ncbi:hypothetical protein J1614_002365 [Plenodomus biglobosus]|nr:hypothetical protein J1614_002365 [Plenodomus biglobosus]
MKKTTTMQAIITFIAGTFLNAVLAEPIASSAKPDSVVFPDMDFVPDRSREVTVVIPVSTAGSTDGSAFPLSQSPSPGVAPAPASSPSTPGIANHTVYLTKICDTTSHCQDVQAIYNVCHLLTTPLYIS